MPERNIYDGTEGYCAQIFSFSENFSFKDKKIQGSQDGNLFQRWKSF